MKNKQNEAVTLKLAAGLLFGMGTVFGYFLRRYLQKNVAIHGDTILASVKKQFLAEGPIEGSWIELKKIPLRKFTLKTDVYYGGISRIEEDELVQYEFIADAYSGTVLDIYRI